jgi:ABC-type sulfate transport system substrate-binding protein
MTAALPCQISTPLRITARCAAAPSRRQPFRGQGITIMKKSLILLAGLSVALFSTGAQAGHWKFDVVNKSNTAAVEFRTQENGEWSHNWIENRIESGDTFNMDFNHDDGDCSVRTQIQFADGSSFDAPVDYCKVATLNVYNDHLTME